MAGVCVVTLMNDCNYGNQTKTGTFFFFFTSSTQRLPSSRQPMKRVHWRASFWSPPETNSPPAWLGWSQRHWSLQWVSEAAVFSGRGGGEASLSYSSCEKWTASLVLLAPQLFKTPQNEVGERLRQRLVNSWYVCRGVFYKIVFFL